MFKFYIIPILLKGEYVMTKESEIKINVQLCRIMNEVNYFFKVYYFIYLF